MVTPPPPPAQHISPPAPAPPPKVYGTQYPFFEYHIGLRVYDKFANGQVEYLNSEALHHQDSRNPEILIWIAIRMAKLHRVIDQAEWADPGDGTRGEPSVTRNVRNWTDPAREVVMLLGDCEWSREVGFERFIEEWVAYYKWVVDWEKEGEKEKESLRVFCHSMVICSG